MYWHFVRLVAAVVYFHYFLCIRPTSGLQWLFQSLQKEYGLKKHLLELGSVNEVRYPSRMLRRGAQRIEWESDPKHVRMLVREYGMDGAQRQRGPDHKERAGQSMGGKPLDAERASKARRGIAIIN